MRFNLLAQDGAARRGRLEFSRGTVETPAFMPVGTYGTVKAMTPEDLEAIGTEIVLGNTFHLYLRPGLEVIQAHDGLHRFMHWRRPILTDSGGFQVWSLAKMRKISEEGARFRSPVDGAEGFLSPEESMRIQRTLASDVAMSFDECTPYPATEAEARASMELSMRWALRGFHEYYRTEPPGTLFGIVQGGIYPHLRLASLAALEEVGFAGLAVYFSVLLVRGFWGYQCFRRVRPTAILTWPNRRPSHLPFLLGLGLGMTASLADPQVHSACAENGPRT